MDINKQCGLDKHLGVGSLLGDRGIINPEEWNWYFHGSPFFTICYPPQQQNRNVILAIPTHNSPAFSEALGPFHMTSPLPMDPGTDFTAFMRHLGSICTSLNQV